MLEYEYVGYAVGGFFGVLMGMYLCLLMVVGVLKDIRDELRKRPRR